MQITAQLPTQYVQSIPHNRLNVKLLEVTHCAKLLQEHCVRHQNQPNRDQDRIPNVKRLCR